MDLVVHHTFDTLTAEQSGKQHKFTWSKWDAANKQSQFLCHAMYQSGEDAMKASDGNTAKRGQIIRLQFAENGDCTPGHGLEIKIDDAAWSAKSYERIAHYILEECTADGTPLSPEQKAAALGQLASVYNLMATQYGVVFSTGLGMLPADPSTNDIARGIDAMVTDQKLRAVSEWFSALAAEALSGKPPIIKPLTLPTTRPGFGSPGFRWNHTIEVHDGAKVHGFGLDVLKNPLPAQPNDSDMAHPDYPYRRLIEGGYMSGKLGEKIMIAVMSPHSNVETTHQFGLQVRLGADAITGKPDARTIQSLVDPVPATQNATVINEELKAGRIDRKQAIASLVMLASLYRLVATGYNSGFGYNPDGSKMPPHYFDEPASDVDARTAKIHAFRHAHLREETFDVTVKDGAMYTRPKTINNTAALYEFVDDSRFAREADNALAMATLLLEGRTLESMLDGATLPNWRMTRRISPDSVITYR